MMSLVSSAQGQCVDNVDKLQLFYVNGMFTSPEGARSNRDALDRFQDKHLGQYEKYRNVQVAYNVEAFLVQVAEVAFHKMTEEQKRADEGRLLENFILGHIGSSTLWYIKLTQTGYMLYISHTQK
ncbi:hypothetical protein ACP3XJ_15590 [Vibrio anguillarum]